MLEKTDNDLPKANDEKVSDETSIPITKKEDKSTKIPIKPSIEAVTVEQAKEIEAVVEKQHEESVKTVEEAVEATKATGGTAYKDSTTDTEGKEQEFEGMDPRKILDNFSETLRNKPIQSLKKTVEALTKAFEKEMTSLKAIQRQAFIDEGGNEEAFYFNPPLLKDFNNLIRRYKSDRSKYYKSVEEKQQKSLEERLALIEELKGLISIEQDINATTSNSKIYKSDGKKRVKCLE